MWLYRNLISLFPDRERERETDDDTMTAVCRRLPVTFHTSPRLGLDAYLYSLKTRLFALWTDRSTPRRKKKERVRERGK